MAVLKYEEIAESLRARIAAGEFEPGETVPSGRDLAEQWSVSRATTVKAMDVLRNDGVVVAKQGTGFVVTETPIARPAGARRAGSARIAGGMPFVRLGTPDWTEPADRMSLPRCGWRLGPHALRRRRILQLPDGSPHSYAEAWFPPEVAEAAPRLTQTAPIAEGTTRYVRRQTGRFPVEGVDVTKVRLATEVEAEHLALTEATAVAVVLHTAYDQEGCPLVCEEGATPVRALRAGGHLRDVAHRSIKLDRSAGPAFLFDDASLLTCRKALRCRRSGEPRALDWTGPPVQSRGCAGRNSPGSRDRSLPSRLAARRAL